MKKIISTIAFILAFAITLFLEATPVSAQVDLSNDATYCLELSKKVTSIEADHDRVFEELQEMLADDSISNSLNPILKMKMDHTLDLLRQLNENRQLRDQICK